MTGTSTTAARWATIVALVALAAFTALALSGVAPFHGWYYQLAWYPTLVILAAAPAWRSRRSALWERPRFALSLFLWSAPVWYFFELLNFRIANWYYVGVTSVGPLRWAGTVLAFATVLPAIYLGYEWISRSGIARSWRSPRFEVRSLHLGGLFAVGVAFLSLALWRPDAFFPLVWGAVTLLVEPWNYRRDPAGSLLGDLARGRWSRIVRLLLAGAAIGLLWELFNSASTARWIYTVPGLERLKLFEMPLPGFLGFPVFALDCFVIYRALVNLGVAVPGWDHGEAAVRAAIGADGRRREADVGDAGGAVRAGRTAAAAVVAAVFVAGVQAGIDRWTVDAYAYGPEELPGVTSGRAEALRRAGLDDIRALTRTDSVELADRGLAAEAGAIVRAARLAALRGLGAGNASALWRGGVRSVCDLADLTGEEAAARVRARRERAGAGRPARARVWIRAAREACGPTVPDGSASESEPGDGEVDDGDEDASGDGRGAMRSKIGRAAG